MNARGPAPDRCGNCGFAQKYSRQKPGEKPAFCVDHNAWLCFSCRCELHCQEAGHKIDAMPPRVDVTGIPPNDGVYATIDDEVYHSDLGSLSSSGARDLLSSTPEEFDFNRRTPRDPNRNYDFGHAAHKMVLGRGSRLKMLDPKKVGLKADGKPAAVPTSTSMWKNAAKAAREQGQIPIAKADMERAQTMAARVFQHRVAARLLADGRAEHSIYWHDDTTGVRLRCRPDFITDGLARTVVIDYKTAVSASKSHFDSAIKSFGYHQQQAFYEDGLAEIGLTDVGFLFVVQSKTAPYTVAVRPIDPEAVELGRRQNRVAIELFARCMERDRWPGYDGIQPASGLPAWLVKQIEESLGDE